MLFRSRIVAALLLAAGLLAGREYWSARKAQRSAEVARRTAEGALRTAEQKTNETENALKAIQRKDDELEGKNESLRMWSRLTRQERLTSASTVAWLADELIQHGTPQQSLMWRKVSGSTLLELGRLQEAEVVLNDTLKQAPDDEDARTSRGYLFLLNKDPKDAVIDFKYIRDNINPHSTLNYLNLSIAQAELGEHKAAQTSIDLGIKNILPTRFSGAEETEEIGRASCRERV